MTTKNKKVTETQKQDNLLDRVISNITEDQKALDEQNELIESAKSYKREIIDRIKDSRRDLIAFAKYASDEQLEIIKSLNIDLENSGQGLSNIAQLVLDILQKQPKGLMNNGDLYTAYLNSLSDKDATCTYTAFNIKCRSLFNSQRLLKSESKDSKSSREDIISINGFSSAKK